MEYLLTFPNTHHVIHAENSLKENKIVTQPMPLPLELGDFCGVSLRIESENLTAGLALLNGQEIPVSGVYQIKKTSQGRTYTSWKP